MYWLLNPRVIAALVMAVVLATTHIAAYRSGSAHVRAQWEKERTQLTVKALEAEQAARKKEQALIDARQQSEKRYVDEKRKAAAAAASAQSALDGLREQLAARDRQLHPADSASGPGADGAARPERELLGACAQTLVGLAEEADGLKSRVFGLQEYVKEVCQKR